MATLKPRDLAPLLAKWDSRIRLLLFAGPDEAASAGHAREALGVLADPADPMGLTDIPAEALRQDPGKLADEAAATSMFGGRRAIRVTGAGDSSTAAVHLLLAATATENPVVMVAGNLPKSSTLRKCAEGSPLARLLLSYPLTARDAAQALHVEARRLGLEPERGVAGQLLQATGGESGILHTELEKFATYLDASPESPKPLTQAVVESLGAGIADEDLGTLINALTADDARAVGHDISALAGTSAIPALRRMARRLLQLLEGSVALQRGLPPMAAIDSLRPPVFWKEKDLLAAALPRWPAARVRAGLAALLAAEQAIKAPGSPGDVLGWQALLDLLEATS